MLMDGI